MGFQAQSCAMRKQVDEKRKHMSPNEGPYRADVLLLLTTVSHTTGC